MSLCIWGQAAPYVKYMRWDRQSVSGNEFCIWRHLSPPFFTTSWNQGNIYSSYSSYCYSICVWERENSQIYEDGQASFSLSLPLAGQFWILWNALNKTFLYCNTVLFLWFRLKLVYLVPIMWRPNSVEKTLMLKSGGEGREEDDQQQDGSTQL